MTSFQTKKLFYVNSSARLSGTHSDFTYALDMKDHDLSDVVVLQANIPKSYYLVQASANTFSLDEGSGAITVNIPIGNYNRTNLATTLATLLTAASASWTYTVTTPPRTAVDLGKYTFGVTGNGGVQPTLIFAATGNIHEICGFDAGSSNVFVGDSLESVNVVKLMREDTLLIHSDIVGGSAIGILQEVYSDGRDYDHITFVNRNVSHYTKPLINNNGNVYRFYLSNEEGDPMDLNGLNWTMTLCVHKHGR